MFSPESRDHVRAVLLERAQADELVCAAASVGSAARGAVDRWSDIDLALRLVRGASLDDVAAAWTSWLSGRFAVADTLDVHAGGATYRVFLLLDSLQVDLSFWPHDEFRGTGAPFRLLFGEANEPALPNEPNPRHEIGMAWLYALHARSATARDRGWQATMMLDGLRDRVVALASLRYGLDPQQGREADRLPSSLLADLAVARAGVVDRDELVRSLAAHLDLLAAEVHHHDPTLADRLRAPFQAMIEDGHLPR